MAKKSCAERFRSLLSPLCCLPVHLVIQSSRKNWATAAGRDQHFENCCWIDDPWIQIKIWTDGGFVTWGYHQTSPNYLFQWSVPLKILKTVHFRGISDIHRFFYRNGLRHKIVIWTDNLAGFGCPGTGWMLWVVRIMWYVDSPYLYLLYL